MKLFGVLLLAGIAALAAPPPAHACHGRREARCHVLARLLHPLRCRPARCLRHCSTAAVQVRDVPAAAWRDVPIYELPLPAVPLPSAPAAPALPPGEAAPAQQLPPPGTLPSA